MWITLLIQTPRQNREKKTGEKVSRHVSYRCHFVPNTAQGNTGVLLGMLLVSLVVLVALVTVMSGIGVCEHCGVGGGGIYSMISTVLGGRVGGTVGLLYVFGQVRRKPGPFYAFLCCLRSHAVSHLAVCSWSHVHHGVL